MNSNSNSEGILNGYRDFMARPRNGLLPSVGAAGPIWLIQASGPPALPDNLLRNFGEPRFYEWRPESHKWYCKLCRRFAEESHTTSKMPKNRAAWPDSYLYTVTTTSNLQFNGGTPSPPSGAPPPQVEEVDLPLGCHISSKDSMVAASAVLPSVGAAGLLWPIQASGPLAVPDNLL